MLRISNSARRFLNGGDENVGSSTKCGMRIHDAKPPRLRNPHVRQPAWFAGLPGPRGANTRDDALPNLLPPRRPASRSASPSGLVAAAGGAARPRCCRTRVAMLGAAGCRAAVPCRHRLGLLVPAQSRKSSASRSPSSATSNTPSSSVRLRLLGAAGAADAAGRATSANREIDAAEFTQPRRVAGEPVPELQAITWIDDRRALQGQLCRRPACTRQQQHARPAMCCASGRHRKQLQRWRANCASRSYSQPAAGGDLGRRCCSCTSRCSTRARSPAWCWANISVDGLLRYGMPSEVAGRATRSPCSDAKGGLLAGNTVPARTPAPACCPGASTTNEYEVPVSPVGNALVLRAQAYRTSQGVVGNGLFWLVGAVSVLTRLDADRHLAPHAPPRCRPSSALVAETNFRRAMENSMLTGMRALDLRGPHHLRERRLLRHDRLERGRTGRPDAALPLLARVRPRGDERAAAKTSCTAAPRPAASRCA